MSIGGGRKARNLCVASVFVAPAGDELVRAVMRKLGCSSPAELADAMGWRRGTERLIAKWLAGNNNPGYEKTLEMLERCGWLTLDGDARAAGLTSRPTPEELLAEVSLGMAALLDHFEIQIEAARPAAARKRKPAAGKSRGRQR